MQTFSFIISRWPAVHTRLPYTALFRSSGQFMGATTGAGTRLVFRGGNPSSTADTSLQREELSFQYGLSAVNGSYSSRGTDLAHAGVDLISPLPSFGPL